MVICVVIHVLIVEVWADPALAAGARQAVGLQDQERNLQWGALALPTPNTFAPPPPPRLLCFPTH